MCFFLFHLLLNHVDDDDDNNDLIPNIIRLIVLYYCAIILRVCVDIKMYVYLTKNKYSLLHLLY